MAVPKVLAILRLFTTSAPRWRVERIAQELAISPSTAYRCVAELVRAGFLEPVAGGHYVLGPAFIDYDLRMRQGDPLLRAAAPQMAELGAALGPTATVFLTRYYRDCVMFVHIERGRSAPPTARAWPPDLAVQRGGHRACRAAGPARPRAARAVPATSA
jgi:DNA-binding IclR family transcriptional regulator